MRLECIEDLVIGNEKCFTKGNSYDGNYHYVENWGKPYGKELCAANDSGHRHCIKKLSDSSLDGFFIKHFKEAQK